MVSEQGEPRFAAGRAEGLGFFPEPEADWALKRALAYCTEGAATIGDCIAVARRIDAKDGESWIAEWERLGDRVAAQAMESRERGCSQSASEGFLRASNYYRTAEYGTAPDHPRFHDLWRKSVAAFERAGELLDPPIERLTIPFEGRELPAYFRRGDLERACPTVVVSGGSDSSLEEMGLGALAAGRRGFNFFTFDFPGHRGAVHLDDQLVKRPDYEVPFRAALDVLETLDGVDERLALVGYSYGGYVATRVAIHEPRIKALIANSPIIDVRTALGSGGFLKEFFATLEPGADIDEALERWLSNAPIMRAVFHYSRWSWGFSSFSEQLGSDALDVQNVEADLGRIRCPALAAVSADEGEELVRQAQRFVDGIGSETKALHVFDLDADGSNDHCQIDNFPRFQQVAYDWLGDVLAS